MGAPISARQREILPIVVVVHKSAEPLAEVVQTLARKHVSNGLMFERISSIQLGRANIRAGNEFRRWEKNTEEMIRTDGRPFGAYVGPDESVILGIFVTSQKIVLDYDPKIQIASLGSRVNDRPLGAMLSLDGLTDEATYVLIENGLLRAVGKMLTASDNKPPCSTVGCILEGAYTHAEFVRELGNARKEMCQRCDELFESGKIPLIYCGGA
ncbi:hypothetical protein HY990_03795 [Candidatus Micrarchaeota archaeon]|nr:hypothetical protein [Candidatus Micrarchaeota archaeon]